MEKTKDLYFSLRARLQRKMPKEMYDDKLLNRYDLEGPFGPSHDRLRKTYYSIRDKKPLPFNVETIRGDYTYICQHSPGLFTRGGDTPNELGVICPAICNILGDNPFTKQK